MKKTSKNGSQPPNVRKMPTSEKNSKKAGKGTVHFRKKYSDHSQRFAEWVDDLGIGQTYIGRLFKKVDRRFHLRKTLALFAFSLFLSFFMFSNFDFSHQLQLGDIATKEIKSPMSFDIVDKEATEEKIKEAEEAALLLFDYDPEVYEPVYNRIYKSFAEMRRRVRSQPWPRTVEKREEFVKDFFRHRADFEKELGREVSGRSFQWLVERRFSAAVENLIIRTLVSWANFKLMEGSNSIYSDETKQILVRRLGSTDASGEFAVALDQVKDLSRQQAFTISEVRGINRFSKSAQNQIRRIALRLAIPNITLNKQETEKRRKQAVDAVLPVKVSIEANQTLISAGTKINTQHLRLLNEVKKLRSEQRTDVLSVATGLLISVLVLVFLSYLRRFTSKKVRIDNRDFIVMALVSVFMVAVTKFFLFLTETAFIGQFGNLVPAQAFLFILPVAAGPMMVGLLITYGEVVWLFTTFIAAIASLMVDNHFAFFVVSIAGGIAAARGVFACERRNDIYWAGLRTGLVNAVVIALVLIFQNLGKENLFQLLPWSMGAGFIAGILSSLLAMMLVPLLESAFNYTTDVKLLELSNLNHPLMQAMIKKAPGTYHHSLSVGTMVEEAAGKIGANPLLAKVMAYYHDIGKMEHAQYFVENQRPGYNPHDHITPNMSKTILIAHVKDGAEMGLQHKLGKPIIDGILQHHGTTLISYFFNKAKANNDDDHFMVEESEFRYPGPKPQFKEAALVMLADSIEAAARSIDEPTAARLTHLVENIIRSKFMDGQLNECNLTLKELSVIEEAFKKTLLSIHHQRIDYPHMKLGQDVSKQQEGKSNKKKSKLTQVGNE